MKRVSPFARLEDSPRLLRWASSAPPLDAQVWVQLELSAGVWTNVTSDVRKDDGIHVEYGIRGTGPLDRVAGAGTMTFTLKNGPTNSGGLLGYYSPDHANCCAGFRIGTGVRLAISYEGMVYYKFRGRLKSITPETGQYRGHRVWCMAADWMDELARYAVSPDLALQVAQRSDQCVNAIVAKIPIAPAAQDIETGIDTFVYALDDIRSGKTRGLDALNRIIMSEFGRAYVKGDTVQGGTFVFESRHTRILDHSSNEATFNNTMIELDVERGQDRVLNSILATVHPRIVDAAATTVLATLENVPLLQYGESKTFVIDYRNPSERGQLLGGTAMVNPVATTDFLFNTAADGSGTDTTGYGAVTAVFGPTSVALTISMPYHPYPPGTVIPPSYVTFCQVRGKGIYSYEPITVESVDPTSQAAYGENSLALDMPYQGDLNVADAIASYLLAQHKDPQTEIQEFRFFASNNATLLTQALTREISDRIGVIEEMTGLDNDDAGVEVGWFIQQITLDINGNNEIWCSWMLESAMSEQYWILDQVGASELDETTVLGWA